MKRRFLFAVLSVLLPQSVIAGGYSAAPGLQERVQSGELPAVDQRLPENPKRINFTANGLKPGRYGGNLRLLMGRSKDVRLMVVYGYARLIGYDRKLSLQPDIAERIDVKEGRIFTIRLRKGHKWSDGTPFTAEDFRYYWQDVALDKNLSPLGPPKIMRVNGRLPVFTVIDEQTVRYQWQQPNPFFLGALAGAAPLFIYRPARYLKKFHARYQDTDKLAAMVAKERRRNWVALHYSKDRQYAFDNPDLPTLQPWVATTRPPSERFVFKRNPYYFRVDQTGQQLPYIDQVTITIASPKLIPAKVGSGDADLQARSLQFKNYTFLKRGEKRGNFKVRRWVNAKGAQIALYPNLNVKDKGWRDMVRNADFRRALSLAINRHEINQVVFFGLASEGGNTVLPESPLYKKQYAEKYARFNIREANRMLDGIGLKDRNPEGIRRLPDGRPLQIIVETPGEDSEQADVLELIGDSWKKIGVELFIKPTRREILRSRVLSGQTVMSIFYGLDNGVPTADFAPKELVPTDETNLQWPRWGAYFSSNGQGGDAPDMPEILRMLGLYKDWSNATSADERTKIWQEMLSFYADQVFSIGLVAGVPQPVAVNNNLMNVPVKGIYNWDPGAHFGIYRPDTFWFRKGG